MCTMFSKRGDSWRSRTRLLLIVASLTVAAPLLLVAAPAKGALACPRPRLESEIRLGNEFRSLVNVERGARGLQPLKASPDPNDQWGAYRAQYTHDNCSTSCHARPSNEEGYKAALLPAGCIGSERSPLVIPVNQSETHSSGS